VDKFRVKFGIIMVMLVMVIAGSACGPSEEATPEQTPPTQTPPAPSEPGANQPPEVLTLTPAQTQVYPSSIIEVRCDASDPDGDALTYDWSSTGGTFYGTGNVVSWVAPEEYGNWDITVTVKDGKGGITQASVTVSVVRNRDPVISSLVANPITVLPQSNSTVTCVASDPDGDVLVYSWKASDGEITGMGDTVTWIAPETEGTFSITVSVDDGKGGHDIGSVLVTSERTAVTETFNTVPSETGTVCSSGDKEFSITKAGDDEHNMGYRAFWSFNLHSLEGTDVKEAKLTFTTKKIVGAPGPFAEGSDGLRGLYIWRIYGEPGQLPDYGVSDPREKELAPIMWEPPEVIDVTEEVGRIGRGLSPSARFQVRAGFVSKTNGSCTAQYIEWHSVTLTVTYARK